MADNSQSGGLLGGLLGNPDLLMNLGAGLMSGARYGSNAGEGLMQGLAAYREQQQSKLAQQLGQQQVQTGALNLQHQKLMMDAAQAALQRDSGLMGGGQPRQSGPQQPSAPNAFTQATQPFVPGVSAMPQGVQPSAAPQGPQMPQSFAPPSMSQVYGTTYPGGMPANYAKAMSYFSQDPLAAQAKFRSDQLALAQQQYAPALAKMDSVINSADPVRDVKADPELQQVWGALAQAHNLNPDKDATPENIRGVFSFGRNALASSISKDTTKPPDMLRTQKDQYGRTVQVDSVTGKITVIPDAETASVVADDGKPVIVPRSASIGRTPYNQFNASDAAMSSPGGALLAKMGPLGVSFPGARTPQAQLTMANNFMRNNAGLSPDDAAQQLRTGQLDFNGAKRSTGQLSTLAAATTAQSAKLEKDFASLDPLVQKLPNAPALFNRTLTSLRNNLSFGGDKDSAELVGWLREAATEYAKISSGSTGSAAPAEGNIKEAVSIFQNAYTQGGYEGLKNVIMGSAQHKLDSYKEGLQYAASPGSSVGRGPASSAAPAGAPQEGAKSTSRSGKPIIFQNGHWQYQ